MRVLKENLFLVCVIGVTLVGAVVLYLLAQGPSEDFDKLAAERSTLSEQMTALANAKLFIKQIEQDQFRLTGIKNLRNKVEADALKFNVGDGVGAHKVMNFASGPAIPIDSARYARETLWMEWPKAQRDRMMELLAPLKITAPPTDLEYRAELDILAPPTPAGAPGAPSYEPGEPRPYDPMRDPMIRPGVAPGAPVMSGTGTNTAPTGPRPEEQALINVVLGKSQKGLVYADENSVFIGLSSDVRYNDWEYWLAQVSQWVQQDVVRAIAQTNEEASRLIAGQEVGVANSAVKHLVRTKVFGYLVKRSAVAGAAGGPGGGGPAMGDMSGASGSGSYIAITGQTSAEAPQLTGRTTNKLYDVVHYEFTVVMSAKQIQRLYRALESVNYHTIVDVRMGPALSQFAFVPSAAAGAPMGMAVAGDRGGMGTAARNAWFYYGADPVMEVTITGEMLLLSDWTRGRWEERVEPGAKAATKGWSAQYPPLMPVDMLKQISQRDSEALRPEDIERMNAGAATPKVGP